MRKISLLLFFISIFGYSEFNNNNLKEKEVLVAISRVVKKRNMIFQIQHMLNIMIMVLKKALQTS